MTEIQQKKRIKRLRCKHTVPEIGSLYDIMHDHQGSSLFVLPICWSALHTQLLGCRFMQLPLLKTPTPTTSLPSPSSTVVALGRDLDILMTNEPPRTMLVKSRALRSIMSTLYPTHLSKPTTCADLDMRFGGRLYPRAVRCQVLWKHPNAAMSFDSATTWAASRSTSQLMASVNVNTAGDDPILAYVSRSHLDHIRRNCFRIVRGPNRAYNAPVHRLQSLRSKNLMPSNPDEDQYFIAVLIAMAQRSFYYDITDPKSVVRPQDVKVRVFTVSEEDEAFMVYTATVPVGLLRMFHEPDKAPQGDSSLKIDFARVPVWPVLGLKERLGQALGREIVGDFDVSNIETYAEEEPLPTSEPPLSPISPLTPLKRRREHTVYQGVLNVSFSEDSESNCDDPIAGPSKRRCLEEGRVVGVVR